MKIKNKQITLIIVCWLLYTCSYIGKYGYSANLNPIMAYYGVEKGTAGLAGSLFFFAYGAGQIINGICCKYYNKKYVIFGATLVAGAVNLIIFLDFLPFAYIKYLWLINGMAQSVFWPTLILTLGENLSGENMKKSILAMASTVACGTTIVYAASALFVKILNFKYAFLLGAVSLFAAGLVWVFLYNGMTEKRPVEASAPQENAGEAKPEKTEKKGVRLDKVFLITLISMAIFCAIDNLVKDGFNTWVPTILKERFRLGDSLSISLTIVLPIVGMFGTALTLFLNRFIKDYMMLTGVIFGMAFVVLGGIVLLFGTNLWVLILVLFGLSSLLMHGANGVLTSIAPLYMRDKINPGLLSGLMNGSCYVGSTISSYCLGALAEASGWNAVLIMLTGSCLFPVIVCGIFFIAKKIVANKKSLNS